MRLRFWPRSLLGQVLVAVAGALLVAQAISAVMLFRASEERRVQHMVGSLALQLTAASSGGTIGTGERLDMPREAHGAADADRARR